MVQYRWLEEKVEWWQALVAILSGLAGRHPQTAYAGLHKYLQQERDFRQHVTLDIGTAFRPI